MQNSETLEIKNRMVVPNNGSRGERTFLGGFQLRTRMGIFWGLGFLSLLVLGAIFFRVDTHINAAVDNWKRSQEGVVLMARIQSGIERVQMLEKKYLLLKERQIVGTFSGEISRIDGDIKKLYKLPYTEPVHQQISTLRDGLEQYSDQFLNHANVLGKIEMTKPTGLGRDLDELTTQLNETFKEAGLSDLNVPLTSIFNQAIKTIQLGQREKILEIREAYQRQFVALTKANISGVRRELLEKVLNAHQSSLIEEINNRLKEGGKRDQFAEILTYIASSTDALWKFIYQLNLSMSRRLERARELSRYAIPGAAGAIFLWFMLIGVLLFRSVVGPIQTLASTSERIALGDKSARIPARRNADATGQIACALEKWIEDLEEAALIQKDLQQIRQKQKVVIPEGEGHFRTGKYPIRATEDATIFENKRGYDLGAKDISSNPSRDNLGTTSGLVQHIRFGEKSAGGESIRQISERLTYFSDYITEAALDVERTEALTRYLGEASSHIEILGKFVLGVQDQVNLLTSNYLTGDISINESQDTNLNHRLNSIRETMEQAGLTLQSVRILIEKVNVIGQEIAKTSSDQALEANNKLLSQSRNLQWLLDDIMARINVNPLSVTSLLEEESDDNKL